MKEIALKNEKALENFRIFPFVAWGLVIIFALFVYKIALDLKVVTEDLQAQTKFLQEKIGTPVEKIGSFDR